MAALESIRKSHAEATPKAMHDVWDTSLTETQVIEKSQDLWTFYKMKMNVQCSALCRNITDRNGFEVYRRLSAEFDPITKGT